MPNNGFDRSSWLCSHWLKLERAQIHDRYSIGCNRTTADLIDVAGKCANNYDSLRIGEVKRVIHLT